MGSINNEAVDYKELSKNERLAIFLITLGPELASNVLSKFEDKEIESICREISKIRVVDQSLRNKAVEEFLHIIGESLQSSMGGIGFAQTALEKSKGVEGANSILERITLGENDTDIIGVISEMEPRRIHNLLKDEQAQTIAFIVSNLNAEKAGEVITLFPEEIRWKILKHIATIEDIPLRILAKISEVIKPQTKEEGEVDYGVQKSGGVVMVANILNRLGKEPSKQVLSSIGESDSVLAEEIGKKMFTFEDLIKLDIRDLQRVTREVETNDLVLALKSASSELESAIMKSVSKRAAESLKDELEMLGPVKVKAVQEAQERIIQIVKKLEEEGAIDLESDEGDVIQ